MQTGSRFRKFPVEDLTNLTTDEAGASWSSKL